MFEFDCERCGIHVVELVGEPHPEIIYCLQCRFIVGLETEEQQAEMSRILARQPKEGGS